MFIFVWKGRGWVVPVIFFLSLITVQLGVNASMGEDAFAEHSAYFGLGCWLAAGIVWWLRRNFLSPGEPKLYTEHGTGQTVAVVRKPDFMFIPVTYWMYIFAAGGVVAMIADVLG